MRSILRAAAAATATTTLMAAAAVTHVVSPVRADVLYDSLWIVDDGWMDAGTGNAIGGESPLGRIFDAQMADDFTLDEPATLTRLVVDFMAYNGTVPAEGIWVQIYPHDDKTGSPSEKLFTEFLATSRDWTVEKIDTDLTYLAWRIDIDITSHEVEIPPGRWWINPQALDIATTGDWFWWIGSVSSETIGLPSHVRDGWQDHGNQYDGLWGSTDWIPHDFRGNNTVSMRIEGDPAGSAADLTAFEIVTGSLLGGGLSDLIDSDDSYVRTRSGFGSTLIDLHHMEMHVHANTAAPSPTTLDVTIESRIDEPSGTAQIRLWDHAAAQFDLIGTHPLGSPDAVHAFNDIDASDYVNPQGDIEVSIKHIVFVPFLAFAFESFVDQVRIAVE